MSQNTQTCAKCHILCGYDDNKVNWWGKDQDEIHRSHLCGACRDKIIKKFSSYFGIDCSYNEGGLEIEWHEVDRIISEFKQDEVMRYFTYSISYEQLYEREQTRVK